MIEAERTFLEKALILHGNHCRMRDNPDLEAIRSQPHGAPLLRCRDDA